MSPTATGTEMDRRGKSITTFVVFDAAEALSRLEPGDVLEVITDDFEPFEHDMAAWCRAVGNELLSSQRTSEGLRFVIRKGTPPDERSSVAMVISSDGLEELLTPLGLALAAALEGSEVSLFFQGPAVRVLARDFRPKLTGWSRPFSRFAASGLAKAGHIPAQGKLRQLVRLGTQLYVCGPSMEHFKVRREDLIFDDLPIVEYLTFMAVMNRADTPIYT